MTWFANLKIAPKLVLGFALVAVIAGSVGLVGTMNIKQITKADTALYEENTVPLKQLGDINTNYHRIRAALRDAILASDPQKIQAYLDQKEQFVRTIEKTAEEFKATIQTDEMRSKYDAYTAAFAEVKPLWDDCGRLALQGQDGEAQAQLQGKGIAIGGRVQAGLDEMTNLKTAQAKAIAESNTKLANRAVLTMVILICFAIFTALTLGVVFGRIIGNPLKRLSQAADTLATGDVNVSIESHSRDEVGQVSRAFAAVVANIKEQAEAAQRVAAGDLAVEVKPKCDRDILARSMAQVIQSLRNLVTEMGTLSNSAVEGKLATRGKADQFQGGYREIVKGVNDTLDAVIGPLNMAANYVDRISKGDIPPKITDSYNGDFNLIKNNLNTCVDAINALVADVNQLSKGAVEGKLANRADASRHQGDFRKIMQGMNDTLDAVISPLNMAANNFDRISRGDIPPKITDSYNGDFNTIKNNLNTCIDAVNALVADVNQLSRGAVEGKLANRADASKHQGDFQKIVQGMNDTLDAVINPLNMAAGYMDRIAKGDIPPKITDSYNGDFNTIKNNLNTCIDAISALVADANMLSHAAVEGLLTTRADAKKHQGDFQKIVQGVNDTLDALIGPLTRTIEHLERLSMGQIDDDITRDYKGDYAKLKVSFNRSFGAIRSLVADTAMLAQAGVEGKLMIRADASKHQGDFQKIVQGVNDTLDAVVIPINEAAQVLEKVAARDLTARVKGDYRGDLARIKESLNQAVDNLDDGMQQVALAVEQVASAAGQIGSGSQSLAQGASEQASSLEEVSSSLQEMASQTRLNSANAKEAQSMADGARSSANGGLSSMNKMSEAMEKIKASSDSTAKIIKTIDEIAFQTNLLALNAAVEAARAGDAGKGFAVVAEEVRNLAMRSAEAAKNTANMIEDSVKNAENGVQLNQEVLVKLQEINDQANKVGQVVTEIAAASEQQSDGIAQVNTAVEQMNQVTQQQAANSEESASMAEELSGQAEELRTMVSRFHLSRLTTGSAGATSVRSASSSAVSRTPSPAHKQAGKPALKVVSGRAGQASRTVDPASIIPLDDDADRAVMGDF